MTDKLIELSRLIDEYDEAKHEHDGPVPSIWTAYRKRSDRLMDSTIAISDALTVETVRGLVNVGVLAKTLLLLYTYDNDTTVAERGVRLALRENLERLEGNDD